MLFSDMLLGVYRGFMMLCVLWCCVFWCCCDCICLVAFQRWCFWCFVMVLSLMLCVSWCCLDVVCFLVLPCSCCCSLWGCVFLGVALFMLLFTDIVHWCCLWWCVALLMLLLSLIVRDSTEPTKPQSHRATEPQSHRATEPTTRQTQTAGGGPGRPGASGCQPQWLPEYSVGQIKR